MNLHEDSVASNGHGRSGQRWRQNAVAGRRIPRPAGSLDGMCSIEDHPITSFTYPIERAHIGNEVVISKGGAPLGETKL